MVHWYWSGVTYLHCEKHWKHRVVMMPTLSSWVALEVVVMTTSSATHDAKFGIMTTPEFSVNSSHFSNDTSFNVLSNNQSTMAVTLTIFGFHELTGIILWIRPANDDVISHWLGAYTKWALNWWHKHNKTKQSQAQHQDYFMVHIDGSVQERRNSIANALELHLSFTNPSI